MYNDNSDKITNPSIGIVEGAVVVVVAVFFVVVRSRRRCRSSIVVE